MTELIFLESNYRRMFKVDDVYINPVIEKTWFVDLH